MIWQVASQPLPASFGRVAGKPNLQVLVNAVTGQMKLVNYLPHLDSVIKVS